MSGLKKINETPAPVDPKAFLDNRSGRPRSISKKVRRAIDLLATGEVTTTKAAAERVGLTANRLYRAFAEPHIRIALDQRTRGEIAHASPAAAARLVELIHAKSEHVSADVSARILAIGDVRPPDASRGPLVNVSITPGYVIDLSGDDRKPAAMTIDLTPSTPMRADELDRENANITKAHLVKPV